MKKKYIDLSITYENNMQTFDSYWCPKVKIKILAQHNKENRETRAINFGTHCGTHIDAPRHFIHNGKTVDCVPLSQLIGKATLLDLSSSKHFSEISKYNLESLLKGKDITRLIIRFDWDKNFNSDIYYSNHPFFSEQACKWLVDNGCKLLGLDTPQPDNPLNGKGSKKDAPNHKILLGSDVILVEYLCNIKSIKKDNFYLIVAPLKIKDGDGSPARVIGIVDE